MLRALKTSNDLQVAAFLHQVDQPSTHFAGCARNCDTHICSPRQPSANLVDCMMMRHRVPSPNGFSSLSAFEADRWEVLPAQRGPHRRGRRCLGGANYNNPKSFRAISSLVRLFGSIGASGRRTSGLILPIMPRAVFTGVGLVSMNNVLCSGQSL